jgi:hypothetical protein
MDPHGRLLQVVDESLELLFARVGRAAALPDVVEPAPSVDCWALTKLPSIVTTCSCRCHSTKTEDQAAQWDGVFSPFELLLFRGDLPRLGND